LAAFILVEHAELRTHLNPLTCAVTKLFARLDSPKTFVSAVVKTNRG
jgi:hypothetical protein